ncbi:MAG: DUF4097 family beta strand repeat protein [Clostridia bacterium]|nr:DUF4097 family beta strand repeat protein [Clostridia bacterium]
MKKGLIITAIILCAAGLAVFAAAFILSGFDISKLGTAEYVTNTYAPDGEFRNIEIKTPVTDIVFIPSSDGRLSVECTEIKNATHSVSVENGTLLIECNDTRSWFERISLFGRPLTMTVCLPSDTFGTLKIENSTGKVSVPGGFSFDGAEISVSTGSVSFCSNVQGLLNISASTGSVRVTGTEAGAISVSVATGSVTSEDISCKGPFSVKTSTGHTSLKNAECVSLKAESRTGSVDLENVTASESFSIDTRTGAVHFNRCDADQIRVETTTGSVSGTLLSDKIFSAKTSTGSVRVPDSASGGRCEITTSTGGINIEIAK